MQAAARAQRLESAVESAAAAAAEAKQRDIDKYAARRRAERYVTVKPMCNYHVSMVYCCNV
jgi:hypothetical protein